MRNKKKIELTRDEKFVRINRTWYSFDTEKDAETFILGIEKVAKKYNIEIERIIKDKDINPISLANHIISLSLKIGHPISYIYLSKYVYWLNYLYYLNTGKFLITKFKTHPTGPVNYEIHDMFHLYGATRIYSSGKTKLNMSAKEIDLIDSILLKLFSIPFYNLTITTQKSSVLNNAKAKLGLYALIPEKELKEETLDILKEMDINKYNKLLSKRKI